jgi:hypothetical protein
MDKIRLRHIIVASIVLVVLTGCTLPGFSTPTPFSFPTPDKTMTALFEPTQAVPATSASDSSSGADGDQASATPKVVPTNTPKPDETEVIDDGEATKTLEQTETEPTEVSFVGPAVRSGPSITADYTTIAVMDGDLAGWGPPIQKVINQVVFGAAKWADDDDCYGTVVAGWDEKYLYLGVRVKDEDYVQEATKEKIYLGDSIEILFDRYVSADYYLHAMTADDYQIGISPGKGGIAFNISNNKVAAVTFGNPPEAYMWFPKAQAGVKDEIKIGALASVSGYMIEFKIPWSLLGVTNPSAGDHYGFAISINDNDKGGTQTQQTMVSNVATRVFSDPTTWGDLYLRKK